MFSLRLPVLLSLSMLAISARAEEAAHDFRPCRHPVMTWVPPYAVTKARTRLTPTEGAPDPAQSLSHVALQFWVPQRDGNVKLVASFDKISDETVNDWRDWCHARGLRAILCVYNGEEKWDWGLARDAFVTHRDDFVQAMLAELDRTGLDGIDIDLEGDGSFDGDQEAYLAFLQPLSEGVHQRKKQLFVDSFAYIWNAPNQRWWPSLFPLVDGVNSMGYEETGAQSKGWRGYSAQVTAAGGQVAKLLIGVPTHIDRWQENGVEEQLQWFVQADGPGVALWDAQFKGPAWKSVGAWETLRKVVGK